LIAATPTYTPAVSTSSLPAAYDPAEVEPRITTWWEQLRIGAAEADAPGEPFSIMLPLPNVTGSLHVGHAIDHSLQDSLIRHARMRGANALWQPGMDHAGIATQAVVERQLAAQGITRHDLGREAFVAKVWEWKEESGGTILRQMRRLGASCDWDRSVFTLDDGYVRAVREVFCALYEQDLIYRGNRLINWDPVLRTALSDIEVDHEEVDGELAYLRYPSSDPGHATHPEGVVVATTRAETMLGDTAVAVHPDDERYAALIGTTVRLPLVDRDIPVIADDAVDPAFGTGAVKVTPAHDPNDYEIGLRHGLPMIDVMTDDARISEAGGPYAGLDRLQARARVTADLDAQGLLVRVEAHRHPVGHSSRSGAIVEPRLSDQWFVRVGPLAERAVAAVRDGRTRFVPERNTKGFLEWLENLHDWCISRQLWWGHRIPAWYDADGRIVVLRDDPTPEEIERRGLVQDPDVLDTWFSSQLWPFVTLGWPEQTDSLRTWYPTSVLVTGYDINTFWVSRMLMAGLHLLDDVPFGVVLNHGLVRDRFGKKMSKSFGNVVDPLELIDRHGADALRFALLRAARPGADIPLAEEWVEGARRFANKLWNAARLVLGRVGGGRVGGGRVGGGASTQVPDAGLQLEDRWILSRLEATRAAVDDALAGYDLARAAEALYHFVWDEYCDWYLELTKSRDDAAAGGVLGHVLDVVLRLLHPIMPFVTEELWRTLTAADEATTLARASWPAPAPRRTDPAAERGIAALQDAVTQLRRFRLDARVGPGRRLPVVAVGAGAAPLAEASEAIGKLARADLTVADAPPAAGALGRLVLADAELYIALDGLVDLDVERTRIRKELKAAQSELGRAQGKLANERFVAGAAAEVVQAERDKLERWQQVVPALDDQLRLLG